jgi:hypothetical protein
MNPLKMKAGSKKKVRRLSDQELHNDQMEIVYDYECTREYYKGCSYRKAMNILSRLDKEAERRGKSEKNQN